MRIPVALFVASLLSAGAIQFAYAAFGSRPVAVAPSAGQNAPQERRTNPVNVLQHGVIGDGVKDDAAAIRRIFEDASGKTIIFPGNHTYLIATHVQPKVKGVGTYPAMDDAGFIISNQSNFRVIADGAVFKVSRKIPLTVTALIERRANWSWQGGTFVGERAGLHAGQENAAFALINNNRFRVSGVQTKGFGGNGAAFVGDWNVAGVLTELHLEGVGICFDFAFSKQLTIRNVVAIGASTNGATGPGQVGSKCFSEVNDAFYKRYNRTGVPYSGTDGVTVENLDASNFNTGVAISSGRRYRFINVALHDNPGTAARNIPGLGYYFFHTQRGAFSTSALPVSDVIISGGNVARNERSFRGAGLLIESPEADEKMFFSNFTVTGVIFDDNVGSAIEVRGSAVRGLRLMKNSFVGGRQTIRLKT